MNQLKTLALAGLIISAPALAAQPSVYVNLGTGLSSTSGQPDLGSAPNSSKKNYGFAYRIGLGSLMPINNNWAFGAEMNYFDSKLGSQKVSDGSKFFSQKYTNKGFDLLGVARYNFTPNWYLDGKLGFARIKTQDDITNGGFAPKDVPTGRYDTNTTTRPEVGLGVGYLMPISDNMSLNLGTSLDYISGSKFDGSNKNMNMTSVLLNVGLNFGLGSQVS